jgi:diguanylate cyclase (GGDEF)-like protein
MREGSSSRGRGESNAAGDGEDRLYSLTQIRHLMRVEFARATRYDYPLTCLMIGVDSLSTLRDRAGYDAKESALQEVIQLLRKHTRGCDALGRLVDERLLAILPHTPYEGALVCAQRLLQLTAQARPPGAGSITLSIGLGERSKDLPYFDQLLDLAEAALERALAQGGNRIERAVPGAAR